MLKKYCTFLFLLPILFLLPLNVALSIYSPASIGQPNGFGVNWLHQIGQQQITPFSLMGGTSSVVRSNMETAEQWGQHDQKQGTNDDVENLQRLGISPAKQKEYYKKMMETENTDNTDSPLAKHAELYNEYYIKEGHKDGQTKKNNEQGHGTSKSTKSSNLKDSNIKKKKNDHSIVKALENIIDEKFFKHVRPYIFKNYYLDEKLFAEQYLEFINNPDKFKSHELCMISMVREIQKSMHKIEIIMDDYLRIAFDIISTKYEKDFKEFLEKMKNETENWKDLKNDEKLFRQYNWLNDFLTEKTDAMIDRDLIEDELVELLKSMSKAEKEMAKKYSDEDQIGKMMTMNLKAYVHFVYDNKGIDTHLQQNIAKVLDVVMRRHWKNLADIFCEEPNLWWSIKNTAKEKFLQILFYNGHKEVMEMIENMTSFVEACEFGRIKNEMVRKSYGYEQPFPWQDDDAGDNDNKQEETKKAPETINHKNKKERKQTKGTAGSSSSSGRKTHEKKEADEKKKDKIEDNAGRGIGAKKTNDKEKATNEKNQESGKNKGKENEKSSKSDKGNDENYSETDENDNNFNIDYYKNADVYLPIVKKEIQFYANEMVEAIKNDDKDNCEYNCVLLRQKVEELLAKCKFEFNQECKNWWHIYREHVASYVDEFDLIRMPNYEQYFRENILAFLFCVADHLKKYQKELEKIVLLPEISKKKALTNKTKSPEIKLLYNEEFSIVMKNKERHVLYRPAISIYGIVIYFNAERGIYIDNELNYRQNLSKLQMQSKSRTFDSKVNIKKLNHLTDKNKLNTDSLQRYLDDFDAGQFGSGKFNLLTNNGYEFMASLLWKVCIWEDVEASKELMRPDVDALYEYARLNVFA